MKYIPWIFVAILLLMQFVNICAYDYGTFEGYDVQVKQCKSPLQAFFYGFPEI